jgi:hypothetical protein
MPRLVPSLAAVATLAAAAACSNPTTPTQTPTTPPSSLTETFSQTLGPNGAVVFPFNATGAGAVTASLSTISPDSTLNLSIDLGTWNGATCNIQFTTQPATQGAVVSATATSAGSLCARVSDPSSVIVSGESIIVTVTHF